MAHSISAKKRIRQNAKRRALNRTRKTDLRDTVKSFTAALATGDAAKITEAYRKTSSNLDKVAAKNTIHKNAASRRRSRLAKRMNAVLAKGEGAQAAKA